MMKRFEIWLVGLDPATGAETAKTRPSLIISPDIGENTLKELAAKGHLIRHSRAIGSPVVLVIDPASGLIEAAGDPRTGRHAGAY